MTTAAAATPVHARPFGVRVSAALAGAVLVALAAQVALPIPGTPVPFTLQPLAVLIVGGLLGPRYGALSMVLYLAMGAAGLPVFTPGGLPGLARLFGPTGGYLLAYPVAAAVVGRVGGWAGGRPVTSGGGAVADTTTRRSAYPPVVAASLAGLAGLMAIHAGGLAQLTILTGSAQAAFAAGVLPFLAGDLIKVFLAALVIRRFASSTRALH